MPGNQQKNTIQQHSLKILTYNVQIFNLLGRNTFGEHQKLLFQFINTENPDVICFQEFYTNRKKGLGLDVINKKLKAYPYHHIEWIKDGDISNYGIAIYSKYPITNKMKLSFQNTNNSTIFSDIVFRDDTIRLFNNHLQSIKFGRENYQFITNQSAYSQSEKIKELQDISFRLREAFIKRAEQADHLSREIELSPHPVIVCGDFNDTPVSYTYRKIRGDLKDSFLEAGEGFGETYEGKFPSYRIDYILHSKELETFYYETRKVKLSDHYPVVAEILVKAAES
jgi:endonuclease/exonuclease/phosphatase family metal-dependent hydrolase